MSESLPKSEIKAKTPHDVMCEMLPFALYAAFPILLTITIAFTLGTTAN